MSFAAPTLHVAVSDGLAALTAQAASDPGSSRLVYAMVIGLVAVGVASVVLAVWLIRQTRVDPDVLAPLERMGDGDWRRKDPATQRRLLDEVRPDGAEPLHTEPAPPGVDDEFENAGRSVRSLDDLEPLPPEGAHQTPAGGAPFPDTLNTSDTSDTSDLADTSEAGEPVTEPADGPDDDEAEDADVNNIADDDDADDEAEVDERGSTRTTDAERR